MTTEYQPESTTHGTVPLGGISAGQPATKAPSKQPSDKAASPDLRDLNAVDKAADSLERLMQKAAALEEQSQQQSHQQREQEKSQPNQQEQPAPEGTVDQNLVRETRNQIRTIVNEISALAQSDCSVEEFFDGFMPRVTSALASVGGAVWQLNDSGKLDLTYQINMAATGLTSEMEDRIAHDLLLNKIVRQPESLIVPPKSGAISPDEPGNPTDHLLVIDTLMVDRKVIGIVEIFQRAGSGPATQRGYLRFLTQMCAIASDFMRNHRLRLFQNEQQLWEKLEGFIRGVHNDLDPRQTAYTIANEGRRLIGSDRVSVARTKGRRCKLSVVSGLDSFDRRAADIKLLNDLTKAVVKADKPLWYNGDTSDLSPQIEKRLQKYVDKSHATLISIVPLSETERERDQEESGKQKRRKKKRKLGALVVEQLADSKLDTSFRKRVNVVAAHSCDALTNAHRYDSIFLKSLWERIGRAKNASITAIPIWVYAMALIGVGIFLMCVTPYDFELSSEGRLTPQIRSEVFAPANGVISRLHVPEDPQAIVEPDQLLAQLTNEELNVEIENLEGKYKEIGERIKAIGRTLSQDYDELERHEARRLDGEASELHQSRTSIQRTLAIKRRQLADLNIVSPARGQVVTWQLREKLLRRPISVGDNIMTIVDPTGPWELELEFPEKKMGHLLEAKKSTRDPLEVTFVLASDPQKKYVGKISKIDRKADVRGESGNTVLVRASFNKDDFPKDMLLDGTRVTARVHCGERPIGYVLLHDVIETVQHKVMFWF